MKYWEQLLVNDIRRMSVWLIMSDHKVKQREERWILRERRSAPFASVFYTIFTDKF